MEGYTRIPCPTIFIIVAALAILFIPATSMAIPDDSHPVNTLVTSRALNVTNASLPDPSALPEYRVTPEPVKVQVQISDTLSSAPKGEMALGPRTIGFSTDPMVLAAGIIIVAVIGFSVLWYIRRNRDEEKEQ
jgi:hypothetical protein